MSSAELTPRESAVLAAVERRLTNPEIAAEMFVSVRTVESHIASLRRKLAAESRAELVAAAGLRRVGSVSVPLNPLRGRDAELGMLHDTLREQRWVTLTGPGGVGKTRLALEYATRTSWTPIIVELEHADPGDVVARICRVVGLEASPGADPFTGLATALSAHPYLLVLDNIDRVGPATGDAVRRVLASAPALRVLTTSRTPVGDQAETVLALAPLAGEGDDSPAAQLLADRLGTQGRSLTRDEREHVAHIAARLDGVPLALELAASVARHLPLAELAERLDHDFAALDRAAPAGKHRTLETTFEWTWDLLSPQEQDVLQRLAALPRAFDTDLAVAATWPGADGLVMRLLDHSLIVPLGGRPQRFRLLAVLREYVHARTDPALIRAVQELHAEYYDTLAVDFTECARADDSAEAVRTSERICPEVNAALRWTIAAEHPSALRLARSLSIGVAQYGSDVDSINSLALAARDEQVRRASSPHDLLLFGTALAFLDMDLVEQLATLALERAHDDPDLLAAHHLAGMSAAYRASRDASLAHLDEAERLALALGDAWQAASVSQMRGIALHASGDVDGAIESLETAMRRYAHAGDRLHIHNSQYQMALIAAESGVRLEEARQWAAACVDYATETSNRHELAHGHLVQALLGTFDGDVVELIDEFRGLGDLRCLFRSTMLRARGVPPLEAIALLEQAEDIAHVSGSQSRRADALRQLALMHWSLGDRAATLGSLDRLADIAGVDAAREACPPELAAEFASAATRLSTPS